MHKAIPTYHSCSINTNQYGKDDTLISRFEPYLEQHNNLCLPHKHSFYHLLYFTKGTGTHVIDFETFEVKKGQIYFMSPGQVHSWQFKQQPDGYIVNFSENFFRSFLLSPTYLERFSFFNSNATEGVVQLAKDVQAKAQDLFEELLHIPSKECEFTEDMLRIKLLELFMLCANCKPQTKSNAPLNKSNHIVREFKRLVDERYIQLHLPKQYAELLYITPNNLNMLCKQLLGKPAGEVIRDRLLLEAKRLLVNVDMGIAEIAYKLSFTDHAHFTKFFKKETGETPDEFRKRQMTK